MTGSRTIGSTIRQLRRRAGLSLQQVANAAEVTPSFLSLAERGQREVSLLVLRRVARALEVSESALYWRAVPISENLSPKDKRLVRIADELATGILGLDE